VRWACDRVDEGRQSSGRSQQKRLVVAYLFLALAETRDAARDLVRPIVAEYLSAGGVNPLSREAGIPDALMTELNSEYMRGRVLVERISDEIVDEVAAAGPAEHCARWVADLASAGADVVALMPVSGDEVPQAVRRIGEQVLPLLRDEA
jgi:alkanesulfonate monooxygenase SsuD/methylene tetrahydromethanopterin reductase-like flavin-dependent oxidoreductase (luciferase family)